MHTQQLHLVRVGKNPSSGHGTSSQKIPSIIFFSFLSMTIPFVLYFRIPLFPLLLFSQIVSLACFSFFFSYVYCTCTVPHTYSVNCVVYFCVILSSFCVRTCWVNLRNLLYTLRKAWNALFPSLVTCCLTHVMRNPSSTQTPPSH